MWNTENRQKPYTVSRLTEKIKDLLEDAFPFVWVGGEISNLSIPASGHCYFTLKDEQSVIQCVLFRNQKKHIAFDLDHGMKIMGMARISVYKPRGVYQLIFEHLQPEGAGALQVAFEQLKQKLSAQGLFDSIHKKQCPLLPDRICIITSETGAAIQDIMTVVNRRFPSMAMDIIPVSVQGNDAAPEICKAIRLANRLERSQVIILARGGGSLEDLQAFNTENVARAVFDSIIPVITGIGHETDYTIADFAADVRAPTPSAAAELAVPDKKALLEALDQMETRLKTVMNVKIQSAEETLRYLVSRIKSPGKILDDYRLTLADHDYRLDLAKAVIVKSARSRLCMLAAALKHQHPGSKVSILETTRTHMSLSLKKAVIDIVSKKQTQLDQCRSLLENLNPMAVLRRGYSITRTVSGRHTVMNADQVDIGDMVDILLYKGTIKTKVIDKDGKEKNI